MGAKNTAAVNDLFKHKQTKQSTITPSFSQHHKELLTYGYVKRIEQLLNDQIIPHDIVRICCQYYDIVS